MSRVSEEMCVARAEGAGAGRFLASSLADALQDNASAVGIRRSLKAPAQGEEGLDFVVFNESEDSCEVIRAGLDSRGVVVSSELLRSPKARGMGRPVERDALLRELCGAGAIAALSWDREAGERATVLCMTVRKDRRVTIALGLTAGLQRAAAPTDK